MNDGLKCLWNPDEKNIEQCINYGSETAERN